MSESNLADQQQQQQQKQHQQQQHVTLVGSSSSWSETDIVKRGNLHVKQSIIFSFVRTTFKSWRSRLLVLRDSWLEEDERGETVLEIHSRRTNNIHNNLPTSLHIPSKFSMKMPYSSTSPDDLSSSWSTSKEPGGRDRFINLKDVKYVDVYRTSRTFPHAFIVHRDDRPPLIFGARSDLEMREWLMAIRLLADKACKHSQPLNDCSHISCSYVGSSGCRDRNSGAFVVDLKSSSSSSSSNKFSPTASNFRCFVVDIFGDELEASTLSTAQMNGQFLFCVSAAGLIKIVSRQSGIGRRCKSCPGDTNDSDDNEGMGGGRREMCHWRVEDVRKLKSENLPGKRECVVTLQTSSRCREFPGTYRFHTMQGVELIQHVRKVASKLEEVSVLCGSTEEINKKREKLRSRKDNTDMRSMEHAFLALSSTISIPKPPPRPLFTISDTS